VETLLGIYEVDVDEDQRVLAVAHVAGETVPAKEASAPAKRAKALA